MILCLLQLQLSKLKERLALEEEKLVKFKEQFAMDNDMSVIETTIRQWVAMENDLKSVIRNKINDGK